tara:strand:+ start:745 stop:948 length:204 start_codon:yes stop_codon:yes gene_type:complete
MKYRIDWWERVHYTAEVEADSVDDADELFREHEHTTPEEVSSSTIEVQVTPHSFTAEERANFTEEED